MANDTHSVGFFAAQVLDQTAARQPHKTAIITKEEELTFAALNQRVHALAGHLQKAGVKQGERVGVLLPNCAAIPLSYFATQKIGAVTVILDARLKGKELQGVLCDADLKLLIVHSQLLAEVREAFKEMAAVALWIVGGDGEQSFEKRYAAPAIPAPPRLNADDDALILYTSGTTGEPKGVVLSCRNLAQYPMVMDRLGITDTSTMRGCILPMSHIVGPVVCNELAQRGYTLVIFDQINPVTLLEGIQKHRVTVFESVPIVFQLLLGVKNLAGYDTGSVKIAAMMGTSIPLPLLRAFQTAQPHIKVIQGYGLTETSPMITLVEPEKAEAKMGSIGRAVPGVEVKIVDDSGQEVTVGEAGEIITRGPHVMKGYFRKAAATAERIRGEWLYTGDVGKREADGYYYHLGRRDDMIITGGLNVYPAEVENMIYTYPGVQETIVFAIPDSKRGQVLGAAVVARSGSQVGEKELLAFLRANLANFKVPDRIVVRESLPRTSSGKTIRDAATLLST
ncbi:MAG: AMP-binding protein [Deltaproteobacteria bacterium]|nr:AMP-binding protein [Deltaproteobacteria bacterium]MBI2179788.1 AMP-binding protein [Deltaproteobacteria bacterium]MBI2367585.1 AMP-binding protein [Deltaproteobacteria bacterium]